MDPRVAGNKVISNACRGERSDIVLHPAMSVILIVSFLVFSIYYLYIIRVEYLIKHPEVEVPPELSAAALILLIVSMAIPLGLHYVMLLRNVGHSERERELRSLTIGYLEASAAARGKDVSAEISALKAADARISSEESPTRPRDSLGLLLIPALIFAVTLLVRELNHNLGEVSLFSLLLLSSAVLILDPSTTSFPYRHESGFDGFSRGVRAACAKIGLEVPEFAANLKERDRRRLVAGTVCTLGILSVYWGCLLNRDMNAHMREQHRFERAFVRGMRELETGQAGPVPRGPDKGFIPR